MNRIMRISLIAFWFHAGICLIATPSCADIFPMDELIATLGETDYLMTGRLVLRIKKNLRANPSYAKIYAESTIYIQKTAFMRAIADLADEKLYPYVLPYLTDDNEATRIEAIISIGSTRISPYDQKLRHLATSYHDNESVLSTIIEALGQFRNDETVNFLASYLTDERIRIRLNTIEALGINGTDIAVGYLIEAFGNQEKVLHNDILRTLGDCRNSVVAIEFLRQFLADQSSDYFTESLISLGELQDASIADLCIGLATHESRSMRKSAIYALSRLGSLKALAPLTEYLENPAFYDMETNIKRAIEQICAVYRLDEILDALSHTDHPAIVARDLGKLGDPSSIEVFMELLDHDDPINRIAAIGALSEFDDPAITTAFIERLPEAGPLELYYLLQVLADSCAASSDIEILRNNIPRYDPGYHAMIMLAANLNQYDAEDAILDILKNPSHPYRWVAVAVLQGWPYSQQLTHVLKELLRKGSLPLRFYSAWVLTGFAQYEPGLLPFLRQCHQRERNPRIREIFEESLVNSAGNAPASPVEE